MEFIRACGVVKIIGGKFKTIQCWAALGKTLLLISFPLPLGCGLGQITSLITVFC
jgi:hypothetical protein